MTSRRLTVITGPGQKPLPVATVKEASEAVRAYIEFRGLGSNAWSAHGVGVVRSGRNAVARISYNGRAWHPDGREIDFRCHHPSLDLNARACARCGSETP